MIWVYAISSVTANNIYVGMTSDLEERLKRHNSGWVQSTRQYAPFKLIYTERCEGRVMGRQREKYWKSGTGKEQLRIIRDTTNL